MKPIKLSQRDTGHVCDEACGIHHDSLCPCWFANGQPRVFPLSPDTVAQLIATLRHPSYRPLMQVVFYELFRTAVHDEVTAAIRDNEQLRRRDAIDIKAHLATIGIRIEAKDGKLLATPAERVTAEVKQALACYREILLNIAPVEQSEAGHGSLRTMTAANSA